MKFNKENGIVYDTIFFGVLYFNLETYKSHVEDVFGIMKQDFPYFKNIREIISKMPDELYPFFYTDWIKPSFMTKYFADKAYKTFDEFIDHIQQDKTFKIKVFTHYIKKKDMVERLFETENFFELTQAVIKTELDHGLVFNIINLLIDFENIQEKLILTLKQVNTEVSNIHSLLHERYKDIIKDFSTERMLYSLKIYNSIDNKANMDKATVSISYLNENLVSGLDNPEKYVFILGLRSERILRQELNYNQVNPTWVFEAFAHPINREIFKFLHEKEYTSSQLSELLHASRQSVNNHILWLNTYRFITISRRKGPEIYYKINYENLTAARRSIIKYIMQYENI